MLRQSISYYACTWYFSFNNTVRDTSKCEGALGKSICVAFKHIGSACFGGFILAVIQYIRDSLLRDKGKRNLIHIFIFCILGCILKMVEHLTKSAVIMQALTGDTFCVSAKDGFNIVVKNLGSYVSLQTVSSFYAWFGCSLVALVSLCVGIAILNAYEQEFDSITVAFIIVSIRKFNFFFNFYFNVQPSKSFRLKFFTP